MEYIFIVILIILTIVLGCWWTWRKKTRNSAKEVEDMLEESDNYYKKYRKEKND